MGQSLCTHHLIPFWQVCEAEVLLPRYRYRNWGLRADLFRVTKLENGRSIVCQQSFLLLSCLLYQPALLGLWWWKKKNSKKALKGYFQVLNSFIIMPVINSNISQQHGASCPLPNLNQFIFAAQPLFNPHLASTFSIHCTKNWRNPYIKQTRWPTFQDLPVIKEKNT